MGNRTGTGSAVYPRSVVLFALVVALTAGCGGSAPGGGDGGADASSDGAMGDAESDASSTCTADLACDDGLFCNGAERCLPDDPGADADGCVAAEADACIEGQTCDEDGDRCQTSCDVSGDADGDGHDSIDCGGDDCDDADALSFPGNVELCDSAGHDEDCDPTTLGVDGDGDGDGHLRLTCCNPQPDGSALCGDDCDDSQMTVNPEALEVCDGNVDNDCNGLADAADGVCVACDDGYRGFDGNCEDIDECMAGAPCGGAFGTSCTNIAGSYICTCPTGYSSPVTGGTCDDVDECATGSACGTAAGAVCMNIPGDYACTCPTGYNAPATGGSCADIDECSTGAPCGGPTSAVACTNIDGSYTCICKAGYGAPATGGSCTDVNECLDTTTCGRAMAYTDCTNALGGYSCTCATGYDAPVSGGSCLRVSTDLSDLTASIGIFGEAFLPDQDAYTLEVPAGTTSVRLTATVDDPAGVVISIDGTVVASGAASPPISLVGWRGRSVDIVIDPEYPAAGARTVTVTIHRHTTYAKASNTGSRDIFGNVLAISTDGATIAVGAPAESSLATGVNAAGTGNGATGAGAVYVYRLTAGVWAQEAYIKASNTDRGDAFGAAVSLSANGSTLVVGATQEDSRSQGVGADQNNDMSASTADVGAVYVFTRTGSAWSQQEYIKASDARPLRRFGGALSLAADGNTLAVGARDQAYVFTRSGTVWTERTLFVGSNTETGDGFGTSLAFAADGRTLAVAAPGESSSATGVDGDQLNNGAGGSGAAYIFTGSGASWTQRAYIKASNTETGDAFGTSIALSGNGSTLAVASPGEASAATGIGGDQMNNAAGEAGAVYVFTGSGGSWSQQAYIKASNTDTGDLFGAHSTFRSVGVSLASDGSTLAVGAAEEASLVAGVDLGPAAQADNTDNAGAVYVFARMGTSWAQQSYVKADLTIDGPDLFGVAVALSGDGATLACGAMGESSNATGIDAASSITSTTGQYNNSSDQSGAVYVY